MRKYLLMITAILLLAGCGPMTAEDAMKEICAKRIYNQWFYAPMHTGRQVAALEDGARLDSYIDDKYGKLQAAGLVNVEILQKSNWRNVYSVSLTEKGRQLCDTSRTDDEHAFVAVFRVVPESVDSLVPVGDAGMECHYTVVQKDLTPFGEFLSFEEDRRYRLIDTLAN